MPYFIAYSAYVAVTILIRVNAFLESGSDVHRCLQRCLEDLADSEKINAGVKRASFIISKLLFAVARSGPNPFPPPEALSPPWGEIATDHLQLDSNVIPKIIATFQATSPDAAAEQSQLEVQANEPVLSTTDINHDNNGLGGNGPWDLDSGTAAQLLTSLRTNTPAHSAVATPKPPPFPEPPAPFPDIIFGLHSDEAFQSWPDFNNELEAMLWMPGLITNGPTPNG
jgi:hypothetical protein